MRPYTLRRSSPALELRQGTRGLVHEPSQVVAKPISCNGLKTINGGNIMIAQTSDSFARMITSLLLNELLQR